MTDLDIDTAATAPQLSTRVSRFPVTYGTVNRLWCNICDKHENLPDLRDTTVNALEAAHRCGPRTSAWTSPGVS
jgi:hypothetical protein